MQLYIRTVARKCRIQMLALKGRGFSRAVAQEKVKAACSRRGTDETSEKLVRSPKAEN